MWTRSVPHRYTESPFRVFRAVRRAGFFVSLTIRFIQDILDQPTPGTPVSFIQDDPKVFPPGTPTEHRNTKSMLDIVFELVSGLS